MEVISFVLSGSMAHLKQPDTNMKSKSGGSNKFFTYKCLHKPCLLGILGATIGLDGYNGKDIIPEYYQKLDSLKLSIQPINKFPQTTFCEMLNGVGYANRDEDYNPTNYVWMEEILLNPSFRVFMIVENEYSASIKEAVSKNETVYLQYFGKNEYPITVSDFKQEVLGNAKNITTLAPKKDIVMDKTGGFVHYNLPRRMSYDKKIFQYELEEYLLEDGAVFSSRKSKSVVNLDTQAIFLI